jgi:hypothetical protein
MVQMGLGIRGLQNVAKGGFLLSLVVGTGIETLDFIFNDEKTIHDLVAGIGVEAVKAGPGTLAGIVAATITAGMTTVAVMPLFAMAVAVLITGFALNQADTYWRVKSRQK